MAAVALFYPIAYKAAFLVSGLQISQALICIMMAACSAFASPVANLTHLMVFGPGSYDIGAYLKVGSLLQIYMMVASITLIYFVS